MSRVVLTAVGGDLDDTVSLGLGPEGSPGVDDVVVEAAPINGADLLFAAGWFAIYSQVDTWQNVTDTPDPVGAFPLQR